MQMLWRNFPLLNLSLKVMEAGPIYKTVLSLHSGRQSSWTNRLWKYGHYWADLRYSQKQDFYYDYDQFGGSVKQDVWWPEEI
jgi:hypothetical protein